MPRLSFVIIAYDMAREIPRTVQSCLPPYQKGVEEGDVEVLVVDNGSAVEVAEDVRDGWPEAVRYLRMPDPSPSPARALNYGVSQARAPYVCVIIDGARLLSDGVYNAFQDIARLRPYPVIATLGYHLGDKPQQFNPGYDQATEDALLRSIDWPHRPEALFDISCLGKSSGGALLTTPAESNALILRRDHYELIGGYDEAFTIPGGGFVNLDFFKRCIEHPLSSFYLIVGEGSFHQVHGGVSTTHDPEELEGKRKIIDRWSADYQDIRGVPFAASQRRPIIYGEMPPIVIRATVTAVLDDRKRRGLPPPE